MYSRFITTLKTIFIFQIPLSFLVLAGVAFAADTPTFVPLVGIPNINMDMNTPLPSYINEIYLLTIGIGSMVAVIKLMIAGVKWSVSEIVTEKSDAKKDIFGTLFGLALLLIPFMVLNTINPDLVKLDILGNMGTLDRSTPATGGTPPLVQNASGGVNGNATASACNARAQAAATDAYFQITYTAGMTDYGTCNTLQPGAVAPTGSGITVFRFAPAPPSSETSTPRQKLREQGPGMSVVQCNTLLQAFKSDSPNAVSDFTQTTGMCTIWDKP